MKDYTLLFHILTSLFTVLFLISLWRDNRHFRNAVFLLLALIAGGLDLAACTYRTLAAKYVWLILILFLIFLLLVTPVLLISNGFTMMKREGKSFANLLSLLFGILILSGEGVLLATLLLHIHLPVIAQLIGYGFSATVIYVSLVFLAFIIYTWFVEFVPKYSYYDAVIVLGAGLLHGNQVSKLLSERIDKGIRVMKSSSDPFCKLILSGGQGPDESVSEAYAMAEYAKAHGIKEEDIILEDRSRTTYENLRNSQMIVEGMQGTHRTAIVTSGYHVYRAMVQARSLDFTVEGYGAHVARYYWPSAITREYAALVRHYLLPYIAGLLIVLASVAFIILH